MANNPYVNKVVYGATTIIDISDTTATADKILQGYGCYGADGAWIDGTAVAGSGSAVSIVDTTDANGGTIRTITGVSLAGDTVTASHLETGYTAHDALGNPITGTMNPGGSPTLQTITKTYTPTESQQTETITASAGYDGIEEVNVAVNAVSSSYVGTAITRQAAQTIHPSATDQTIGSGRYLTGTQTVKAVTLSNLTADNIKSGVIVKVSDSTDDDCVTSVTGTYTGGGGSSKNAQVVQGTTRTNSSSLTAIGSELTVSKTGTYDIYYSCLRTNTSSSYTWGTRLYINGTAHGNENTTWTNNVQNTHLTNVSLTSGQKLMVYGRETRGTSYYVYAPMLAIVEV